ncbi:hypothetical protein [Escherichia coli]|uniref:hypothetical protein n=2 Tax=Escherichia coli TaxID=562 RepID=UPI0002CB00E3|nr:hypothetical protein [Escherichia coli]EMW38224.1 hypothetical protein EC2788150_4811 [Escherichia coli 2788150]
MSIIRFTEYRGSGGAGAVMVLAERITHFYRQYGTHDGTVIELDTGKNVYVLENPDEVKCLIEQDQKDT